MYLLGVQEVTWEGRGTIGLGKYFILMGKAMLSINWGLGFGIIGKLDQHTKEWTL
jgi:hypothetical protein